MFLDAVESVNLLVNSNGSVVVSEVMGTLKMRVYLSGMPECKLGLNDKVGAGGSGPGGGRGGFYSLGEGTAERIIHITFSSYVS